MIEKLEVKIEDDDTYGTLYEKMKVAGGKLIIETLEKIADGIAPRTKQPEEYTMAPMIEKSLGNIDWSKTSKEIRNLIRGLNPMPGAYTNIENEKMKIWKTELANIEKAEDVLPGTIIEASSKEGLLIATGDGVLNVLEIQMPNSKKMLAKDYFNGHTINKGIMCNM